MASNTVEALIGGVVLAGAAGFLVYAANTADISGTGAGTELVAEFRKAGCISPGADVRISGVKVGSVTGMELDPRSFKAQVTLSLNEDIELADDSGVRTASESLLSDSYVAIVPGFGDIMLEAGDEIDVLQDCVNLMDLVGKFIQGSGAE
ncbi:MAG: outer membrane lipid asymmetry maintenance protein MlaD [Pseudomonadota bacterium]